MRRKMIGKTMILILSAGINAPWLWADVRWALHNIDSCVETRSAEAIQDQVVKYKAEGGCRDVADDHERQACISAIRQQVEPVIIKQCVQKEVENSNKTVCSFISDPLIADYKADLEAACNPPVVTPPVPAPAEEAAPPAEAAQPVNENIEKLNAAIQESVQIQAKGDAWVDKIKKRVNKLKRDFDKISEEFRNFPDTCTDCVSGSPEENALYNKLTAAGQKLERARAVYNKIRSLNEEISDSKSELLYFRRCFVGRMNAAGGPANFGYGHDEAYFTKLGEFIDETMGQIRTSLTRLENKGKQISNGPSEEKIQEELVALPATDERGITEADGQAFGRCGEFLAGITGGGQ
ncbi:MAG: hypothetical protein HY747_09745 [Elusimicrobia bacterium]|nr:hypothetical protein [Elusimicrobiota bacterium]